MAKIKIKLTDSENNVYFLKKERNTAVRTKAENEATVFVQEKHTSTFGSGIKDAYYLKLDKGKVYLDQESKSGKVFFDEPNVSVKMSTIWAWKISDGYMCAVNKGDQIGTQKISEATKTDEAQDEIWCKLLDQHKLYKVEWITV